MVTGSTLQEEIASTARQLLLRGRNILGFVKPAKTAFKLDHDQQTPPAAPTAAPDSPSFSWVDHRLVRHEYLARAGHAAWTLYLFLVTVADAQGLSFYSDAAIGRRLTLDQLSLAAARQQLIQADLIAYRKPLYQVLALPEDRAPPRRSRAAPRRPGPIGRRPSCAARWKEAVSDRLRDVLPAAPTPR